MLAYVLEQTFFCAILLSGAVLSLAISRGVNGGEECPLSEQFFKRLNTFGVSIVLGALTCLTWDFTSFWRKLLEMLGAAVVLIAIPIVLTVTAMMAHEFWTRFTITIRKD